MLGLGCIGHIKLIRVVSGESLRDSLLSLVGFYSPWQVSVMALLPDHHLGKCCIFTAQEMPFLSEPTVGEVEQVFNQAKGTKTTSQMVEEVWRRQMQGQEPFTARYAQEETPQQRQAKQQAADAAMKKLLGEFLCCCLTLSWHVKETCTTFS